MCDPLIVDSCALGASDVVSANLSSCACLAEGVADPDSWSCGVLVSENSIG